MFEHKQTVCSFFRQRCQTVLTTFVKLPNPRVTHGLKCPIRVQPVISQVQSGLNRVGRFDKWVGGLNRVMPIRLASLRATIANAS